jgi:uncharacterized RDD family membrane protein YckC
MRTRATTWAGLVVLLLLSADSSLLAQPWQVAGDGTHLWVLRSERGERDDARSFVLLHRARGATTQWDRPDHWLRRVDAFSGQIVPGGIAAAPGELWIVFDDMSVESLRIDRDEDRGLWRYVMAREHPLPRGASLRAMTAGSRGVWALVRAETAEALRQIDEPVANGLARTGAVVPRTAKPRAVLPPHLRPPVEEPTPAPAADEHPPSDAEPDAEPAPLESIAAHRLMHLQNDRWEKVDLPDDWPDDARVWLAMPQPLASKPVIVTMRPGERGERIRAYRWRDQAWVATDYNLVDDTLPGTGELQVMGMLSTLVVARRIEEAGRLSVQLSVLSPEGVVPLGRVSLDSSETRTHWAIAPFGDRVAVIVKSPAALQQGRLRWSLIDLQGNVVEDAVAVFERKPRALERVTEHVLLVGALVIATLIMFVFWRRDPQWNQLELPELLVLADPARRALAAVTDLLPCLYLASLAFDDVGIRTMLSHWPMWSSAATWASMAPAGLAILIFVAYTTFAEMFTARTIGKAIFGLRVTGLRGEPPNIWQVMLRNAMKGLELIAPLLLILPLIGPFRQRLGDLVARTVIVAPRGPEDTNKEPKDSASDEHDEQA